MQLLLIAAVIAAVLAVALFFFHFLVPILCVLLVLALARRLLFGPRRAYAYGHHGPGCGGYRRFGPSAYWSQHTPTVDGRDWQRPGSADAQARSVNIY